MKKPCTCNVCSSDYEALKQQVFKLQDEGKLPKKLTEAEIADWAYGNAVLSNPEVTREMAERAAAASLARIEKIRRGDK